MDCQGPRPALPPLSRGTPLYAARTFLYPRRSSGHPAQSSLAQPWYRVCFWPGCDATAFVKLRPVPGPIESAPRLGSKDSNLNDDASIHHVILSYDPGRMLSYRTIKPPKGFQFPNALAKTWVVVYFEPVGAAQTRVTTHMLGYTEDEESQKMRLFFERGNQVTMDALSKRFRTNAR